MAAPTSAPRLLRVGVLGIGRIGRQQALNCLRAFSQLKLICACSPTPDDIQWASTHLAPYGVATYTSAAEMVSHPDLEAVIIASTTKLHAEHIRLCLSRGLHVLCEKPLAMNSTEARSIVELAAKHPECSIMTAYSRRFDTSYQRALAAVQEGKVGMPVVIRSQTCDMYDRSPFYMRYVMANPGIFIDTTIHDVDLTLSFFGADARPAKVWATGTVTLHPELEEINDFDNAVGVVEWYPDQTKGVPKRISYFYVSRTMKHGFDNSTEIIGTNGSLKINLTPRKDQVEVADEGEYDMT
ncbi:hypothetical protein H2203_004683 [Taxawa tesnikishii (nom. ined.)]|nr:hypothetical protein H2203_004683 [Dothideales sp. JES 119]